MQGFDATIGNRRVEAAGTIVHEEADGDLVVRIAGAEIEFRFVATGTHGVDVAAGEGNRTIVTCDGFDNPLGTSVRLPDLFDAGERKLEMLLFFHSVPSDRKITRLITFTVF